MGRFDWWLTKNLGPEEKPEKQCSMEDTQMMTQEEMKMVYEMVMLGVYNGNHIEPKAFLPTPEQYKMLHQVANKLADEIRRTGRKNKC